MDKKLITITESADLSGKSIQTIRRAIKAKKIRVQRKKTPQGFNYLIEKQSLVECYNLRITEKDQSNDTQKSFDLETSVTKKSKTNSDQVFITRDDFNNFTHVLDKMVNQHSEERQNFMRLVNTMQEKIFVLENQLNLLSAPQKKWYQVWK